MGCVYSVYPSENLETTARAKGLALSGVIAGLVGFINTFAGPIGLKNIQNNYVWGAHSPLDCLSDELMCYSFRRWDCVEAAAWWFAGVETQGRVRSSVLLAFGRNLTSSRPSRSSMRYTINRTRLSRAVRPRLSQNTMVAWLSVSFSSDPVSAICTDWAQCMAKSRRRYP